MPSYEFGCLECKSLTLFFLNKGQKFCLSLAKCETCGSKNVTLDYFVEDTATLVLQLQLKLQEYEARINYLANNDDNPNHLTKRN